MSQPAAPVDVLVVGAGIAGSLCARELRRAGRSVCVVDKGRGPGGRMATRRTDAGSFDHGAQYFTARDERFRRLNEEWMRRGVVQRWRGRFGTLENGEVTRESRASSRYVGVPGMNAIVRDLQAEIDVAFGERVVQLWQGAGLWSAATASGSVLQGRSVVIALPAPQAVALVDSVSPLARELARVRVEPCWATMVSFGEAVEVELDGIRFTDGKLSWAARDSSKPGRAVGERWVLHSAQRWAATVVEGAAEEVAREMLAALEEAVRTPIPPPARITAHRWLYALVSEPVGQDCLWDGAARLGVCGDACRGGRIEDAALSGQILAARMCAE